MRPFHFLSTHVFSLFQIPKNYAGKCNAEFLPHGHLISDVFPLDLRHNFFHTLTIGIHHGLISAFHCNHPLVDWLTTE